MSDRSQWTTVILTHPKMAGGLPFVLRRCDTPCAAARACAHLQRGGFMHARTAPWRSSDRPGSLWKPSEMAKEQTTMRRPKALETGSVR